jgi:hypothetical protein
MVPMISDAERTQGRGCTKLAAFVGTVSFDGGTAMKVYSQVVRAGFPTRLADGRQQSLWPTVTG